MLYPSAVTLLLAGLLGTVIGSFLNVVIARLPRAESFVAPGSRCPSCTAPIRWYDNVPLLSFLALRGRCRACGASIAWRYPLVEATTAVFFVLAACTRRSPGELATAWTLLAVLVAVTAIDLEHQIIPDRITLPGIAVGFVTSFLGTRVSWLDSLLGIFTGGGILLAVIVLSGGGMGGGDMKLGAMIGAFLGYKLALLALLMAVILGGAVALGLLFTGVRGRKDPIPFGPFLAGASAVAMLWGEAFLSWYLRMFSL